MSGMRARAKTLKKKKQVVLTARGEATRHRLMLAAREVFERDGFAAAKITEIARRANGAIGTFHTYFESKEAVLGAVVEFIDSEFSIELPGDVGSDALARIEAGNRLYIRRYVRNARIYAVVQHEAFNDRKLLAMRQRSRKAWVDRAERNVRRLQDEGRAPKDVSARFLASALSSMVQAFCYENFAIHEGAFDEEEAAAGLTMIWIRALGIRSTGTPTKRRARS